jgi:hypothetical protein
MWYMYGMPRTNGVATHLQRAALLTFVASLIFWAFFQISKSPNFAAVNPFAEDPVDAIGSIAVQVALAVGVLTLARAAQVSRSPIAFINKGRLILRGNSVALLAIGVTLVADAFMELQNPMWGISIWGQLLVAGLGTVALIACAAGLITVAAARQLSAWRASEWPPIGEAGSLGEALDDLWALVRMILAWLRQRLPWLSRPLRWIDSQGNRLFEWLMSWPWISPRSHPWRFCASVGLLIGIGLALAHRLEEGSSINLAVAAIVSVIFIGVELMAVLIGYLVLGGFLGLRPPLKFHRR